MAVESQPIKRAYKTHLPHPVASVRRTHLSNPIKKAKKNDAPATHTNAAPPPLACAAAAPPPRQLPPAAPGAASASRPPLPQVNNHGRLARASAGALADVAAFSDHPCFVLLGQGSGSGGGINRGGGGGGLRRACASLPA